MTANCNIENKWMIIRKNKTQLVKDQLMQIKQFNKFQDHLNKIEKIIKDKIIIQKWRE